MDLRVLGNDETEDNCNYINNHCEHLNNYSMGWHLFLLSLA